MNLRLGCIADDYTGASDLANTLRRNGLKTIQTIGVPSSDLPLNDAEAVVIALKSRSIRAAEAVALSRHAANWLRARGAAHVMFKICSTFDSTDQGNIGPVMEALQADCGAGNILVTPAFPETGRSLYLGHLFVNGVPLHESPLKDHPLNPMHDSNLVRVLARQSPQSHIGLIDLPCVAEGAQAIKARAAKLAAGGVTASVIDAVFERDLIAIGSAALAQPLSVGASGLGLGLARALAMGDVKADRGMQAVGGHAACLVGSCSRATLEQIERAAAVMPVLRLNAAAFAEGDAEIAQAISWAGARLAKGPVLLASSGPPEQIAAMQARFGSEKAGRMVERALADIAAALVGQGVKRLVIGGGETSGAVVDRLGVPAFEIGPEIAPGVPLLRSLGGPQGDILMALKSGNFGGPDFFTDALAMMT